MRFKDQKILVLATGEIEESPADSKRKWFRSSLQIFDGDLAGQHQVYAPDRVTLETLEKGEHLVDIDPVHNNYAAIEYRMGNIRKLKATIQQSAKP